MKKLIVILVAALFLFSSAFAENDITFQGIPWLADDTTTMRMLTEAGFIRDNTLLPHFSDKKPLYFIENEIGHTAPDRDMEFDNITYTIDLLKAVKGKIAGYPVDNLILTFAYNGTYQLIAVKIDLAHADYNDLKAKIKRVYGEGEQKITEEGIESNLWKGENNSAILLYSQSEGLDYTLMYGRLDATEILSDCLTLDPNDVSGL